MNPGIQQDIARAAVEAGYRFAGLNQAEVAETAYIQHRTVAGAFAKQCFMKRRDERCALAAGGYIAAAKVADHGDARSAQ